MKIELRGRTAHEAIAPPVASASPAARDAALQRDLGEAPVAEHACMKEVLVDRGQLQLERLVQVLDDFGIALQGRLHLIFATSQG